MFALLLYLLVIKLCASFSFFKLGAGEKNDLKIDLKFEWNEEKKLRIYNIIASRVANLINLKSWAPSLKDHFMSYSHSDTQFLWFVMCISFTHPINEIYLKTTPNPIAILFALLSRIERMRTSILWWHFLIDTFFQLQNDI